MAVDGVNHEKSIRFDAANGNNSRMNQNPIQKVISWISFSSFKTLAEDIGRKVMWTWNTTLESLKADIIIITILFACTYISFGIITTVQIGLVYVVARCATIVTGDKGLQGDIDRLVIENSALRGRNQELIDEKEIDRVAIERIEWERGRTQSLYDAAESQLQEARRERDEGILSRAPLLNEKDRLQEKIQQIEHTLGQMSQESAEMTKRLVQLTQERDEAHNQKAEAVSAKQAQEGEYRKALREVEILRARFAQTDNRQELNRLLNEFHQLYLQAVQNDEGTAHGATFLELQTLIPLYKSHRARYHEMLDEQIHGMEETNEVRILLEGILEISKDEIEHLERISETFHLDQQLRRTLSELHRSSNRHLNTK